MSWTREKKKEYKNKIKNGYFDIDPKTNKPRKAYACVIDVTLTHMIIIRENSYPKVLRKFGIPKGSVNNNETGFEAAKRELFEEVGIDASNWLYYGENYKYIFIAPKPYYDIPLIVSDEVLIAEWFEIKDVKLSAIKYPENYNLSIPVAFELIKKIMSLFESYFTTNFTTNRTRIKVN